MVLHIDKRLQEERKKQGITQKELAELADVSLSTVQRLEQPERGISPRMSSLERIDVALWINNCYRFHGQRTDEIGDAIRDIKTDFESKTKSVTEIRLILLNLESYINQKYGVEIPANMPGFIYYSLLEEPSVSAKINTRPEHELMVYFRQLNETGQSAAVGYTKYLSTNPEYQKEETEDE